jgi:glycosyltransferase involved in cell wall biosynthesis
VPVEAVVLHLVCHLIDSNADTGYFRSIARRHDRSRFPVMIGSLAPPGALQRAIGRLGVGSFSLGARERAQYALALVRLVRLIRRHRVTLVHAHCFDPTFVGLLAARVAGVPFVFTRHHSDHNIRLGKRWHTRVDAWCAQRADHVIAVSHATRRIMEEVERVPARQISIVYNGMEGLPQPSAAEVERLRRDLGLDGTAVCLTAGRLHEEKGHLVLFEAAAEIRRRIGHVVFLVAGEGPHRAAFEEAVRRRGLAACVRFLGHRSDVAALLSVASVVAVPSLAESFGFSVLEAMSLGRPVVASTAGGIKELIADEEEGLLVPPGDATALADAACRLLEDVELAQRLGERARLRATAFGFEEMIRGYEAVYERVLGSRARAAGANMCGSVQSTL